jgi:hypothetical protein
MGEKKNLFYLSDLLEWYWMLYNRDGWWEECIMAGVCSNINLDFGWYFLETLGIVLLMRRKWSRIKLTCHLFSLKPINHHPKAPWSQAPPCGTKCATPTQCTGKLQ